jgi:hypothetical protein
MVLELNCTSKFQVRQICQPIFPSPRPLQGVGYAAACYAQSMNIRCVQTITPLPSSQPRRLAETEAYLGKKRSGVAFAGSLARNTADITSPCASRRRYFC